jgi:DNA-binding transcriptional regulator LsrR (DeoR family)
LLKIFSKKRVNMVKLNPMEEQRLLAKVSKLYYEEGFTQDEIIGRLNLSRSKISRLLQQAREQGVVQITVIPPEHLYSDLEDAIEKRYGLQEVVVVEVQKNEKRDIIARELGSAAARYLERVVGAGMIVGVSWGLTLHSMVAALRGVERAISVKVVQVIGGLGQPEAEVHATELCRRLARLLGCQPILLPAPGIVANKQVREVMLADPYVRQAVVLFDGLDVAFVGIGSPSEDSLLMKGGSILTQEELSEVLQRGAVGDIALRFFDRDGIAVQSEVDQRVIGITLEQLKAVPRVIGVAGGIDKFQAIAGALRGKLVNALITDSITAEKLLC